MKLLFFCADQQFLEPLSDWLSESCPDLDLRFFSDAAAAGAYWQTNTGAMDCVLGDEALLALAHDGALRVLLGDQTVCDEDRRGVQRLNLYQAKGRIVTDLRKLIAMHLGGTASVRGAGSAQMVTFFSTQGGGGKTTLAYLTALAAAAAQRRVAYLNLELTPSTQRLYQVPFSVAPERLLFTLKDRQPPEKSVLPAAEQNADGVYVLPTHVSLTDRLEMTRADLEQLLLGLERAVGVDLIVADCQTGLDELTRCCMERCGLLCAVFDDSPTGRDKCAQLRQAAADGRLRQTAALLAVGNRCVQKHTDGVFDVLLPRSQSVEQGTALNIVLGNNTEIAAACAEILRRC